MPLLDGIPYGKFVFAKVPELARVLLGPLTPLLVIYRGVPFVAFGVFLALYFAVVRNGNISRFIRWNTQQAILIDILLIVPQLLLGFGGRLPGAVVEAISNTVFYGVLLAVGYSIVSNIRGELPDQIPGISDSVDSQIGPY